MLVGVDPETGSLGMPERGLSVPLTIEELQAQVRHEAEGLTTVRHPDGSESIEHEGRFVDYMVLRVGPDGTPYFVCAHGEHGVQHALRTHARVRTLREEEQP